MSPLLVAQSLSKSYPIGSGDRLVVLENVNFELNAGEIVAIVGDSGSGKSTLLHLLGALDRPDSGRVIFEGVDIFRKSDEDLAKFRNQSIGLVFQFHHLLPEFSAIENVAMPALIQQRKLSSVLPRARELLVQVGLEGRLEHRPSMLSGGEQQRVAFARALMNNPAIILADEPTGNLDSDTAEVLQNGMIRLARELGRAFVIVTHSQTLAGHADRVLKLRSHSLLRQPA
jgi:lipoprotein-releasing system ATP-binding protein